MYLFKVSPFIKLKIVFETLFCLFLFRCICCRSRDLASFALAKFKNLCVLDVSDSAFGTLHLFYALQDLPQLESLNISHTDIDSFLPFESVKSKLRILIAYNLKVIEIIF